MTKEKAVELILDLQDNATMRATGGMSIITKAYKEKLTAILTELMEPVTEQQMWNEANKRLQQNLLGSEREQYAFVDGMKTAATRNLKVSLEGLMVYQAIVPGIQHFPHAEIYLKSDVEKLVGK